MRADQPHLRLSDDERQETLDALAEHMRTGRLNVTEFGERSSNATTASTRGEVVELFSDLPQPRPEFVLPNQPTFPPSRGLGRRLPAAAVPIAGIALVAVLLLIPRVPVLLLLVPVGIVLAAVWLLAGRRTD
ncbi:DUF1707 SHOCT-like domain-containing protein [Amycolatopsis cihanbeyliensis]|uniref:Uncharacterized protein DUF1707 n=1 Tax=Amycolatopsis cihanbeyliensis TaxID=1128664 RepID=A0A542DNQ7_AMYCI|nr:DUF1707 domain-containing protein [Amycolatopsis cihanbeyliensis]TQJ04732.1 uncharacterized protein DUF1707 [Amycolatopsis cihanbeyliensis]